MAARERQRDKRLGGTRRLSWPTLVLAGGILLSLAANLAQAQPTTWGRIVAATPSGAFLVAVSMLERRATRPATAPHVPAMPEEDGDMRTLVPVPSPSAEPSPARPAAVLVDFARRVAAEHEQAHGQPITRDKLRAQLGVSNQLASDIRPVTADGELTDNAVAGYVAKYTTKAAECTGTLDRRITPADNPGDFPVSAHARRLIAECLRIGQVAELEYLRIAEWAHMLGFRGHFSTKSRAYSTTLGALRAARAEHVRAEHADQLPSGDTVLVVAHWRFTGLGHVAEKPSFVDDARQLDVAPKRGET